MITPCQSERLRSAQTVSKHLKGEHLVMAARATCIQCVSVSGYDLTSLMALLQLCCGLPECCSRPAVEIR